MTKSAELTLETLAIKYKSRLTERKRVLEEAERDYCNGEETNSYVWALRSEVQTLEAICIDLL